MTDATALPSVDGVRASMRAALKEAMRGRDRVAVSALRSGLSAIDNAEAVPTESATSGGDSPIAGAVTGVGATEAERRELTVAEVRALLSVEVDERREAASEIERAGHLDRAQDLRREADVLEAVLTDGDDTIEP